MNWRLISLIGFLALLGGCVDGQLPGGNTGDDDGIIDNMDDDDDNVAADFAATIASELPVNGTLMVGNLARDCDEGTECQIPVDEPREYRVDVECPFHGFVDKHVDVTEDDNGQTIEVATWVWGAMPNGLYMDSEDDIYEFSSRETDEQIEIIGIAADPVTVSEQSCYWEDGDGSWLECEIAEDNSWIWYHRETSTGNVFEDTLTRIDN